MQDSEFRGEVVYRKRANTDMRLISKPIQAMNHEEDETAKIDPKIIKQKNTNFQGRTRIKRRFNP